MRYTRMFAALLALTGCNEILDVDRFRVSDGGRTDAGIDAGIDAGRDGAVDGGTDAGPLDAGPCNDADPDADNDGFESVACGGTDCNDDDANVFPGAAELCDDIDQDCDPNTLGPDEDEDGAYPLTCCNGGRCGTDCDDDDANIAPGESEVCDDVDQDCDGAVDETLLGLVGTPILVEPDYDFNNGVGALGAAFRDGFAVVWKREESRDLLARFFNRDGTQRGSDVVVERGSTVETEDPRSPRLTVYEKDGLEQLYITWSENRTEADRRGIYAVRCEIDASGCGFARRIIDVDPALPRDVTLVQAGNRVIYSYVIDNRDLHVHAIDPAGTTAPSSLIVQGFAGMQTEWGSPAYIEGPTPHLLFSRAARQNLDTIPDGGVTLDGGTRTTYAIGQVEIVRVHTAGMLEHRPAEDVFDWDFADACRATGQPICVAGGVRMYGTAELDEPGFFGIDLVAGADGLDGGTGTFRLCGHPLTARADRAPDRGECSRIDSIGFFVADRGSVATTAVFNSSRYAIRDLPLDPDTEGSTLVPVPGMDLLLPGTTRPLSMSGGHGVLVGNGDAMSGFDVVAQRIGCTPE